MTSRTEAPETPEIEQAEELGLDPELAVAVLLAEAEVLKVQANLAWAREAERSDIPRDMSPLGSRR
jgi:hypothetical protein